MHTAVGQKLRRLWAEQGAGLQGEYDTRDIGRTPSVVEEEIFSYGRPTESLEDIKSENESKKN